MKARSKQARYYGWTITYTLAITETISWGVLYYAIQVFFAPMEAEMGWTRAELTGGFSLALLVMGLMAYPVGAWIDKHGARGLMTVGSLCACLLVVAWSQVQDIRAFYAVWVGIGLCGAAVLYEPAFAVIATWFTRQRGQALATITFAAGLASTIFLPLADMLLHIAGWRNAVLLLALLLALTTIAPHALVLRRRPQDLGLHPDGDVEAAPQTTQTTGVRAALRGRMFWRIVAAFSLGSLAANAVRVHFIPFLMESGLSASLAAYISGSIGILQVTGRLIYAPLSGRYRAHTMALAVYGVQALAMLLLFGGAALLPMLGFIVLFGTAYGAATLARANIVAEVYGATSYGRISSLMAIFLTVAFTVAPVGAGLLHDALGNYTLVLVLALILSVLALVVLGRPPANAQASTS